MYDANILCSYGKQINHHIKQRIIVVCDRTEWHFQFNELYQHLYHYMYLTSKLTSLSSFLGEVVNLSVTKTENKQPSA